MLTSNRVVLLALTTLTLGATTLSAQGTDSGSGKPQTRDGFWIGFGLGAGSLGCDGCGGARESAFSGNFKLGGTINPHFLLGAETNGWYKSEGGATVSYGNLSAVGYYYPSATSGFYLKGGLGWARVTLDAGGLGSDSDMGGGAVLGLGYDARVRRNFSLTPYVNFMGGRFANSTANVVQYGLGFTWH